MSIIQNKSKKQAIVGSLIICSLDASKSYQLATWYRVAGENRKIIKMERIKGSSSVSYRCTVFDIGANIEVILQNNKQDEYQCYGPVKFDNYLAKQLQVSVTNNSWFSVNLHTKINQVTSGKIRIIINEKGVFQIYIQIKKQEICLKIPLRQDWRMYEEIFTVQNVKLTEICLRNLQILQQNKNNSIIQKILREKRQVLITFLNVIQKNIFLAQIVLKTKDRQLIIKRLSQLNIDEKNLDSEMQKLFQSNLSSNQFKATDLSEKVINDFQDVIFTPSLDQQKNQKEFCALLFDQFLNPQIKKQPLIQKLSQIQEQQGEGLDKLPSISYVKQKAPKSFSKKFSKGFFKKQASTQRKRSPEGNIYGKVIKDNKSLVIQNLKLKMQNKILKMQLSKKVLKEKEKEKYPMPEFFRGSVKNMTIPHEKFVKNDDSKSKKKHKYWNSQKISVSNLQSPKSYSRKKHSDSTENIKYIPKSTKRNQLISSSTKTLNQFFHRPECFNINN